MVEAVGKDFFRPRGKRVNHFLVSAPFCRKSRDGIWHGMGKAGKYALSSFRILAIGGILWYMHRLAKGGAKTFVLISFGVVLAGAFGNVLDSLFYGLLFDRGLVFQAEYGDWMMYTGVAQWGSGYAPMLLGNVVDMFYFPLFEGILPEWIPFWGENTLSFSGPSLTWPTHASPSALCSSIGVLDSHLTGEATANQLLPAYETLNSRLYSTLFGPTRGPNV